MLSRYDVVESWYNVSNLILGNVTSHRHLLSFKRLPNNLTPINWFKRHVLDMECIDIPYIGKSPASKPWTCEIHLYLFPPTDPTFYSMINDTSKINLLIPGAYKRLFWALNLVNIDLRDG